MNDRYRKSSYRRYRVPARPDPEPSTGHRDTYAPYDEPAQATPEVSAATPAAIQPLPTTRLLIGAGVALLLVIGAGLVFRAATGPVDVVTPTGTISVDSDSIEGQLEEKRELYVEARGSGDLASVGLTDDAFNNTAVAAFSYFLTDMIIAAGFGVDDDTAVEYAEEAAEYERKLLAGEPLGADIEITFDDGRRFTYYGDTGKGGIE